jgi:heme-degrading monooxygenase HmoA
MICVMTRFRLNHVWHLVSMYRALRSMRADLDAAPGLVRYAFLVEGPRTCYTLSIWESEAALERFINMRSHIAALRRAQRWCDDIWSGYWQLEAVSRSAQRWPGRVPWPALVKHPTHPNRLVPVADGDAGITPALEPRRARAAAGLPHK